STGSPFFQRRQSFPSEVGIGVILSPLHSASVVTMARYGISKLCGELGSSFEASRGRGVPGANSLPRKRICPWRAEDTVVLWMTPTRDYRMVSSGLLFSEEATDTADAGDEDGSRVFSPGPPRLSPSSRWVSGLGLAPLVESTTGPGPPVAH